MCGARAAASRPTPGTGRPSRADIESAHLLMLGAAPALAEAAWIIPPNNPVKQHLLHSILHLGKRGAGDGNPMPGLASTFHGLFPSNTVLNSVGLKLGGGPEAVSPVLSGEVPFLPEDMPEPWFLQFSGSVARVTNCSGLLGTERLPRTGLSALKPGQSQINQEAVSSR